FFAAERKPLTERRISAWREKHGVNKIPFAVVGGKLDLTTGLVDATDLAVTIAELEAKSGYPCVLIILDTVTRTFGPGDQHQSRDMSKYIQSVDALHRATGAHIAAIHHSPWSDDRGKGAIDLDGAVDVWRRKGCQLGVRRDARALTILGSTSTRQEQMIYSTPRTTAFTQILKSFAYFAIECIFRIQRTQRCPQRNIAFSQRRKKSSPSR